mmetsp:Transcript_68788/g.155834  ORF Transcript_68788/g.155834 Transcript_68788/m.155834 type:complete len:877 (+) Transcript_68788:294-2924(+)
MEEADIPSEQAALVVHEDALDAAFQAASRSIDQLIWQGSGDIAKAVTLFGPGIVVLPMLGSVSGVDEKQCLSYTAHPKRVARGGLMDRVDFESKFGLLDPSRLVEELTGGRAALERRLKAISNEELHDEVVAFQDWREKANGRLKTLEKRAAWAFLGMTAGVASQSSIKKAFKKKALELHPDKGGDAERFQLLQEMKELLIVPTVKELEEQEKEEKEKEKEVEKSRKQEKDKESKEEDADDASDFGGFSSDSSYDVDEEFKKMFPEFKKKKTRRQQNAEADADMDLSCKEGNFNREKHEAARRKIHRSFVDMWERAGKLSAEIKRMQTDHGGDAIRQLRKFVDRFANLEVSKLKENDPRKAERILRRFLEQGAEVICAAGAVNPVATVSSIAMQVNFPLLSMAPSDDLQRRCAALLKAVKRLPSVFARYLTDAADSAAKDAADQSDSMQVTFLVPDPAASTVRSDGQELPGVLEVLVELPKGSSLSDLRAAALQVSGSGTLHRAAPRLFCNGKFVAGAGSTPLESIEALKTGGVVQCLPSNAILQSRLPEASLLKDADSAATGGSDHGTKQASAPVAGKGSEAGTTIPPIHKPSPELLAALGLAEAKGSVLIPSGGEVTAGDGAADVERPDSSAQDDAPPQGSQQRRPEEWESKEEEVESKTAQADEGDEDPWFDDFFSDTKKHAEATAAKEQEQEEAKRAAERQQREREEAERERKLEEERAKRKAAQEQGRNALEARLRAQKQAAEAKKKGEKEKKKLVESRIKEEAKEKSKQPEQQNPSRQGSHVGLKAADKAEDIWSDAIVPAKDESVGRSLQRRKCGWDENWEHPCAGKRRHDGSAVFCYPCDGWITVGDPFDHRGFELHCEKLGHYGWID